jgi:hypothetical protein
MHTECDEDVFRHTERLLSARRGADRAVTINQLASDVGISRRSMEQLLETRLTDFPYPLVAGSNGYFIPVTEDELTHYDRALLSRIRCLAIRRRTLRRSAGAAGYAWDRQARRFRRVRTDLFS